MAATSDSKALISLDRVWPQHQAALTLIKDRVENPSIPSLRWLDLACGRGQILSNIGRLFSPECCKKIEYIGFDVINEYCLQAEKLAKTFFEQVKVEVCDIDKFELYLQPGDHFDVVTLTNTVHEITPDRLAATFVSTLCRVKADGFMFMYDMESLPSLELGAIPWLGRDIEQVLHRLLIEAGETIYLPTVATWPHRTCNGWHVHLNRNHLQVSHDQLQARRLHMEGAVSQVIKELLEMRLLEIHQALSSASRYGIGSAEERADIQRLTYDFWAISRALGSPYKLASDEI